MRQKRPNKQVWCIRHAEALHNVAVQGMGNEEDREVIYRDWAFEDARLSEMGESQACDLGIRLRQMFAARRNEQWPEEVWTSPLQRCLQTTMLALGWEKVPHQTPLPPAPIREVCVRAIDDLRERAKFHPCNRRRSRQELEKRYPLVSFSDLRASCDLRDDSPRGDQFWAQDEDLVLLDGGASFDALSEKTLLQLRASRLAERIRASEKTALAIVSHHDVLRELVPLLRSKSSSETATKNTEQGETGVVHVENAQILVVDCVE